MKPFIYADHAATTKLDEDALAAMMPFLTGEYGNPSQPYAFGRKARQALQEARATVAACINAEPEEIFFTSGGTESDNWAIRGATFGNAPGRGIVTSAVEHHAVLRSCEDAERLGCPVSYLPVTEEGVVTAEMLRTAMLPDTGLVSVMLANNEIGTVQPICRLSAIAHEEGALFHTDAVQAVGHIPVDVKELGVDLLSASAHKFNGPKGVGFLYVKKGTSITPYALGGAQESGLRAGTENVASLVGMAVALQKNCLAMDKHTSHIRQLEELLIRRLRSANVDFIRNGRPGGIPGNLSLSFPHSDGEALLHRLDLKGICVSTGAACDTVSTQISHVLKAIGLPESYARGTVRISLGKSNTAEEAEAIARALISILR